MSSTAERIIKKNSIQKPLGRSIFLNDLIEELKEEFDELDESSVSIIKRSMGVFNGGDKERAAAFVRDALLFHLRAPLNRKACLDEMKEKYNKLNDEEISFLEESLNDFIGDDRIGIFDKCEIELKAYRNRIKKIPDADKKNRKKSQRLLKKMGKARKIRSSFQCEVELHMREDLPYQSYLLQKPYIAQFTSGKYGEKYSGIRSVVVFENAVEQSDELDKALNMNTPGSYAKRLSHLRSRRKVEQLENSRVLFSDEHPDELIDVELAMDGRVLIEKYAAGVTINKREIVSDKVLTIANTHQKVVVTYLSDAETVDSLSFAPSCWPEKDAHTVISGKVDHEIISGETGADGNMKVPFPVPFIRTSETGIAVGFDIHLLENDVAEPDVTDLMPLE